MSQPLARIQPPPDTISSWLDVLTTLLDLPESERSNVRAELESHLRDRVRDLIISGDPEHQATKTAIAELGDAASLARRYSKAIEPSHRRPLMQIAVLSVAGAAAIFGIGAIGGKFAQPEPKPTPGAEAKSVEGRLLEENLVAGSALADKLVEGEPLSAVSRQFSAVSRQFSPEADPAAQLLSATAYSGGSSTTWAAFFDAVAKSTPVKTIRWDVLSAAGIEPNSSLVLPAGQFSAWQVLELANESTPIDVAARLVEGGLEFSTREHIDRRERTLVVYDISTLIAANSMSASECSSEVCSLLTSLVYPDGWKNNGGDLAEINTFGAKLFIQAPARYHGKISWLMTEIGRPDAASNNFVGSLSRARGVPLLSDLPILNRFYNRADPLAPPGPGQSYTFRVSADGKSVEAVGPDGNIVSADSFTIEGGTVAGHPLAPTPGGALESVLVPGAPASSPK